MSIFKYLSSIGIIFVVAVVLIMSIVTPNKEVSDLEGRSLEIMPLPSFIRNMFTKEDVETNGANNDIIENIVLVGKQEIEEENNENEVESAIKVYVEGILNGDYFKRWDNYFSDHIYLRDKMVNLYTDIQSKMNKKYINGVYLGKDNFFISNSNIKEFTDEQSKLRAEYFDSIGKEFKESHIYLINFPLKGDIYEDKMPIEEYKSVNKYYINRLWEKINSKNIEIIDTSNIINEENLYNKTDHHWNMNGTWKAYSYIINEISNKFSEVGLPKNKDDYNIEVYENYFIGSDGRKVGQLVTEMDNIEIYRHKNEEDFNVTINNKQGQFFYNSQLNKEKFNNDYMVYLNGDNAEVIVENSNSNNNLSVVAIGDSMDNPLIPLLAPHFEYIYNYDLRYYKDNLTEKIKDINPDIIIFEGLTSSFLSNDAEIFNIYNY